VIFAIYIWASRLPSRGIRK